MNKEIELDNEKSSIHIEEDKYDIESIKSEIPEKINKKVKLNQEQKKEYLEKMLRRFRKKRRIYSSSSQFFTKLNYFITIPSILLTSVSSVLSFVTTTDIIPEEQKIYMNIAIGVLASLTTLGQTLSNTFKYSTKTEMHKNTAEEYAKLITETQTELIQLNDPNFIQYLETKLLEIQNNCKYFPPQFLEDKYDPLNDRYDMEVKKERKVPRKVLEYELQHKY